MQEKSRGRKTPADQEIITNFENQLESTLSPVTPDPDFIQHLRKRLTTTPVMILERESHLLDAMIALGLVMSGILVLVTLLWGIYKALVATGIIATD